MIASGTNGTCTWSIDDNGELYIRPTNNNSGYVFLTALTDDYPWTEYIEQITSIILTGSIYSYKSSWSGPDEETGDFSQLFRKVWGTGQAGGKTAVNVVTIDGIESLKRSKRLDFLLQDMKKLTSIDFSNLDTALVESFNGMFSGCDLLSQVTFGNNFDMSTAIDKAKNDPNGYTYYYYTDFGKGTNQTNGIVVQNNNEFAFLTKAERAGTWSRGVAQSFSSVAQRSTSGTPDEDGDDVIITTTWSTDSEQSNRELKIYQKLASISSYPSTPTVSQNLTGDSGITPITISNIGDDAYDFKVVFYDGVNTFIAFPAVQSNVRLITIDEKGRIECGDYNGTLKPIFDIFYPVGSYYETSDSTFDPNTAWGGTWTSGQIKDDYVVDEINNGIWIGRKWASGKFELYMYYSGVPTGGKHYWTLANNILYGYRVEGFVFPQGWKPLNTTYNVTVNWNIGSGFCMDSTYGGDANGFKIYALATQANVTNVQAKVLVTGYWKSFGSPTKYRWHRTA